MNRIHVNSIFMACIVLATCAFGFESGYREIQASFTYGIAEPSGDWDSVMENGRSLGVELGISVSPQSSVGLHFGFGVHDTKFDQIGSIEAPTSDNDWTRYVGGLFGEYRFTEKQLTPFVGAGLGVHGVHVAYSEDTAGYDGEGYFGFGYGFTVGLQFRSSQRVGAVLRFDLENSQHMPEGWFSQAQLGLRLFL